MFIKTLKVFIITAMTFTFASGIGWAQNLHFVLDKDDPIGKALHTLPLWLASNKNSDKVDVTHWELTLEYVKKTGYFKKTVDHYFAE